MQISNINYNYNYQNIGFRGFSPEYVCSQLCKGACCDHSSVMSASIKRATDNFLGDYYRFSQNIREKLPLKRIVYSWGLNTEDIAAKKINEQINKLIEQLHTEKSTDKLALITKSIDQLNKKLEEILGENEVFLPITNPIFKDEPQMAVVSGMPNICMYKDPTTNKCTIYYGINTPEGKTIQRPTPCHTVGSDEYPCAWLNPEKFGEIVAKTQAMLAQHGYARLPQEVIFNYIAEQQNLNDTWAEKIYKPYLAHLKK